MDVNLYVLILSQRNQNLSLVFFAPLSPRLQTVSPWPSVLGGGVCRDTFTHQYIDAVQFHFDQAFRPKLGGLRRNATNIHLYIFTFDLCTYAKLKVQMQPCNFLQPPVFQSAGHRQLHLDLAFWEGESSEIRSHTSTLMLYSFILTRHLGQN